MHSIHLPPEVLARAEQRRGSRHLFGAIEGVRTAHVVVDMQNGFLAPGAVAEIPLAREIVPNVNRISAAVRKAGGVVVYLRITFDAQAVAGWGVFFDHFCGPRRRGAMIGAFTPGDPGHELDASLEVLAADLQVLKRRFGAFLPGSSDLDAVLRGRGIDTIVVSGTATNICCESTAREAMMMGYKVLFVSDANATHTDAEHNATLVAMLTCFADVVSTEEVVELLRPNAEVLAAE